MVAQANIPNPQNDDEFVQFFKTGNVKRYIIKSNDISTVCEVDTAKNFRTMIGCGIFIFLIIISICILMLTIDCIFFK